MSHCAISIAYESCVYNKNMIYFLRFCFLPDTVEACMVVVVLAVVALVVLETVVSVTSCVVRGEVVVGVVTSSVTKGHTTVYSQTLTLSCSIITYRTCSTL